MYTLFLVGLGLLTLFSTAFASHSLNSLFGQSVNHLRTPDNPLNPLEGQAWFDSQLNLLISTGIALVAFFMLMLKLTGSTLAATIAMFGLLALMIVRYTKLKKHLRTLPQPLRLTAI